MRRLVRRSTGATITVGFGVTLLLILAIGGVSWVFSQHLAEALDAITSNEFPCYRQVAALYARQNDIQAGLGGLAVETDPDMRREMEKDVDEQLVALRQDVRSYEAFPHGEEEERRWQAVRVELMTYIEAARAQRDLEGRRDHAGGDLEFDERAKAGLRRLRQLDIVSDAATNHLVEQMNRDAEDYRVEAVAATAALKRALLGVVLFCSALILMLAYATHRSVKRSEAARRSEAEKALLSRRLELIARYGNDILLLCDREGRIREANESALAMATRARSSWRRTSGMSSSQWTTRASRSASAAPKPEASSSNAPTGARAGAPSLWRSASRPSRWRATDTISASRATSPSASAPTRSGRSN